MEERVAVARGHHEIIGVAVTHTLEHMTNGVAEAPLTGTETEHTEKGSMREARWDGTALSAGCSAQAT
jgi:hypothetical protein